MICQIKFLCFFAEIVNKCLLLSSGSSTATPYNTNDVMKTIICVDSWHWKEFTVIKQANKLPKCLVW